MSRKGILLLAMLMALALVSAACGSDSNNDTASGDEQSEPEDAQSDAEETNAEETETDEATGEGGEGTYVATEFAFEGPDVLPAGDVTLTMDNQGKQMHELALGELLDGKTMDKTSTPFLRRACRSSRPSGSGTPAARGPSQERWEQSMPSSLPATTSCSASCPTRLRRSRM